MHNMEAKSKEDIVRMSHMMSKNQKAKAIKASGILTAKLGRKCSVIDAINILFEEGYKSYQIDDIDKLVA